MCVCVRLWGEINRGESRLRYYRCMCVQLNPSGESVERLKVFEYIYANFRKTTAGVCGCRGHVCVFIFNVESVVLQE